MLGSDEGIKLGSADGKVLGTILGNIYVITLGIDLGTDLVSLNGSLDGYNYGKLEGIFFYDHWDLLLVKSLALMKASKLDLLMVKGLALYLEM